MTTTRKLIQSKLEILKLAEKLSNVPEACKVMGYSKNSFYLFQKLYDEGCKLAHKEMSRSKPLLKKSSRTRDRRCSNQLFCCTTHPEYQK
jgi:hypothetical protein